MQIVHVMYSNISESIPRSYFIRYLADIDKTSRYTYSVECPSKAFTFDRSLQKELSTIFFKCLPR